MVGAEGEAVVFHREPAATTQMRRNRLASLREKMLIKIELIIGELGSLCDHRKNSCKPVRVLLLCEM